MCPRTPIGIYVSSYSSYYYTTAQLCAYCCMCVLMLCVSSYSYCYIRVLILLLLYTCPHTPILVHTRRWQRRALLRELAAAARTSSANSLRSLLYLCASIQCIYIHTHTHTHTHTYTYIYSHCSTNTYTHTHIYTHTNTDID